MANPPLKRLLTALGLVPRAALDAVTARAKRAYEAGYEDVNDDPQSGEIAKGGFGYRSIATQAREGSVSLETNLETAWALWQSNGLAQRLITIKRDYITGGGIEYKASDDDLQQIVDDFVKNNQLDKRASEFAAQLFLFGIQCYPVFVRESDGRVLLGYIDPQEIDPNKIITHPDNPMEIWAIGTKVQTSSVSWKASDTKARMYRVIRPDSHIVIKENFIPGAQHAGAALKCSDCGGLSHLHELQCEHCQAPLTERYTEAFVQPTKLEGKLVTAEQANIQQWELVMLKSFGLSEYDGSCFYYKVNSVSNQTIGYSDLLAVADNIDQWDQTLFALGEREQFADFFSFVVTMTNADQDVVTERARQINRNPPRRGSVLVVNDSEAWDMFSPDLKQQASVATIQEQRRNVIGAKGYPEAWFGAATGTGLATIQAQGDPTWRSLKHDQDIIKMMFQQFMDFARDQASIAGAYQGDGETTIIMPEMTARDLVMLSGAMTGITSALMIWVDNGWVIAEDVKQILDKLAAELGIELNAEHIPVLEPAAPTAFDGAPLFEQAASAKDWGLVHRPLVSEPHPKSMEAMAIRLLKAMSKDRRGRVISESKKGWLDDDK